VDSDAEHDQADHQDRRSGFCFGSARESGAIRRGKLSANGNG
jgi:hypothetical protein